MNCSTFSGSSNIVHAPCSGHLGDWIAGKGSYPLLWGDYLGLAAFLLLLGLAVYLIRRKLAWRAICCDAPGLHRAKGKVADGKDRYDCAKLRADRRYIVFGEVRGYYVYGLHSVTVSSVKPAREAIENYTGTLLQEPTRIDKGVHKNKVYLAVNGLVKKKPDE
jgi:hypothetical protein